VALSRLAAAFAAEIRNHEWSDAPFRADRAGHNRQTDSNSNGVPQLSPSETDTVRLNVMWVCAQTLAYMDANFDVFEFAEAAGVDTRTPSGRERSGHIPFGLRRLAEGKYCRPGSWDLPDSAF
jgi:hypothetical protein